MHYILGIDEVGRGPWAGPIVVGGFLCAKNFNTSQLLGGKSDSKKITPQNRTTIVSCIEKDDQKAFRVFLASKDASDIDRVGIREANKSCMSEVIQEAEKIVTPEDTLEVYIDGCDNFTFETLAGYTYTFAKKGKKSPEKVKDIGRKHITYVIGGDATLDVVGLASIIAKVKRDARMCEYHEKFKNYSFQKHKGYGTRKHYEEILNYGITEIHRKSYAPCKTLILERGWL